MNLRRTRRVLLASLLATTFAVSLARAPDALAFERQDIACELEDLTRFISLRVDPDAGYVCDVLYEKPDEGDAREVLWSARNDVDYCKPRFEKLVEDMAARGWTCDYAERSTDAEEEQPAIGAAKDERAADDEGSSKGARGAFRDRCVADVASGESVDGAGSVKSYCDCVAEGMDSHGLSEGDAQLIFEGLASVSGDGSSGADKRLNTLAANYESVVESCR